MRLIHNRGTACGSGQWQAGGDRLGADEDIRLSTKLLHSEQRAGAPKAALHLVGDQQAAVARAELA